MSLREYYRQDPPEEHWKNPGLDNRGQEYCGHCGDDWPCKAVADGFAEGSEERAAADKGAGSPAPAWLVHENEGEITNGNQRVYRLRSRWPGGYRV